MHFLRRHKYILLSLGIYWPVLFVLTHIPVPKIANESHMSDKTMHLLAYMTLTFFIWLALCPYRKVQWNRPLVWIILLVIAAYGGFDEWLQGKVGRQMEWLDFVGDLKGATIGLLLLTFLSFWPAMLVVSSIFIFAITNLSVLLDLYPQYYLNTAFHLTAYTTATLIWIQYTDRKPHLGPNNPLWPVIALCPPLLLLSIVKIIGFCCYKKTVWWVDVATSVFGIALGVLISYLVFRFSRKPILSPKQL